MFEFFLNNPLVNFYIDIDDIEYEQRSETIAKFIDYLTNYNALFKNYTIEYRQKDNFYSCHLIFYDIIGTVSECKELVKLLTK